MVATYPSSSGALGYGSGNVRQEAAELVSVALVAAGTFALGESAAAAATLDNGTIATSGVGVARVNPGGNRTGVIMAKGAAGGSGTGCQVLIVKNEANFTLTMATQATSNVANGTTCVVRALACSMFVWSPDDSLWYPIFS